MKTWRTWKCCRCLRIVRATGEDVGLPKEDPEYVPPCMVLSGSPVLREMVRDLVSQVEASRKELVVQVTRGGFSLETMRGVQFEQVDAPAHAQSLQRPAALPHPGAGGHALSTSISNCANCSAELAALHPDRDEFECSPYHHENQFLCFRELANKIRSFLRGAVAPSFLKLAFKDVGGMLTANFSERTFRAAQRLFPRHQDQAGSAPCSARYVEDGGQVQADAQSLANRAIRGIEFKEERHRAARTARAHRPPLFPARTRATARACGSKSRPRKPPSIRWTGSELDWSDASFTLYMTVPAGTTKTMTLTPTSPNHCFSTFAGSTASPAAGPGRSKPGDTLPSSLTRQGRGGRPGSPRAANLDYAVARSEIKALFEDMMSKAQRTAPLPAGAKNRAAADLLRGLDDLREHAPVCRASGIRTGWPTTARSWPGDEKFFDLARETLKENGEDAAERLAVFYICIGLGFTGIYFKQPEFLRKTMLSIAPRIRHLVENDQNGQDLPRGLRRRGHAGPRSAAEQPHGDRGHCFCCFHAGGADLLFRHVSLRLPTTSTIRSKKCSSRTSPPSDQNKSRHYGTYS